MSENEVEINTINPKRKCKIITIRCYFLLLCLIVLCQSMITSGYIGSIVSSLEVYYGFSTERLGIAFSSYDITGVISIPLISYIGSKYNRARIVACGAFLFAFGNILFIFPYLINGYNQQILGNLSNEITDDLCSPNVTNSYSVFYEMIKNNIILNQPIWTYYVLILSMIIMSIGGSPFYTLGITFLTDHLKKDDQPIYTSILYGMVALGPAIGFVIGSVFLSEWINIGDEKSFDGITKTDPRWIGRWWAGFIISSSLLFLLSLLLFTFPSHLRQDDNKINRSDSDTDQSIQDSQQQQQRRSLYHLSTIKDIFNNIVDLLKNSTYILIVLINSVESILVASFTTFMVKYIESVFSISSSLSSILTGSVVIPAAICGTITGGYIIRRFHMNVFQCIRFILISCFISSIGIISLLFIKCKSNIKYQGDSQCSQLCNCSPYTYQPVCFQQQITFLSPCHAGCTSVNGTEYSNCTCLPTGDTVFEGPCENACLLQKFLFLFVLFLVTFFETLMATPQLMIVLRSVKHDLQSFGLGLENCIMKLIAQIPAPIVFGLIIDNQCLFWSESISHHRGSCFIFDGNRLPFTLFGTAIIIKSISFTLILILFFIALKRQKREYISLTSEERQPLINNSDS